MSFGSVISGGLSGLAMGGPWGAAAGAAAGLFGGNGNTQENREVLRPFNPKEAGLYGGNLDWMRKLMAEGPGGRGASLFNNARGGVDDSFARTRGRFETNMAKTGGLLGSIGADAYARFARQKGIALGELRNRSDVAGNNLWNTDVRTGTNLNASMMNTRRIGGGTNVRHPNAQASDLLQGAVTGLTSPQSWWNRGGSEAVGQGAANVWNWLTPNGGNMEIGGI